MELKSAASAFAALGHPDRLAVLRLLMRFAPRSQRPTEIARILGLKQNTLSHHLADLAATGLLQVTRQGRSLYYSVNLTMAEGLIGYLALDVGRARPELLAPFTQPDILRDINAPFRVLFLCSGNSARSIMAEALLRDLGKGRFLAYSAGIQPSAAPHPKALQILQEHGHTVADLRSKNTTGFQGEAAQQMDVVITVCDRAAARDCPPLNGYPITAHWGMPDPAGAPQDPTRDPAYAFRETYNALRHRLEELTSSSLSPLDRCNLQTRLDRIEISALIKESA